MTASAENRTTLHGAALWLARGTWIALALFCVGYYIFWSINVVQQPLPTCVPNPGECNPFYLGVEDVAAVPNSIVPLEWYAHAFVVFNVLVSFVFVVVALLIFWRKSDDWMALFVSAVILCIGTVGITPSTTAFIPPGTWLYNVTSTVAFFGYFAPFAALFFFPDGRFVPSWARWVCALLGFVLALFFFGETIGLFGIEEPSGIAFLIVAFLCVGVGIWCMVYRYRKVAPRLQQQQIKWVGLGLVLNALSVLVWITFANLLPPEQPSVTRTTMVAIIFPVLTVLNIFLPVSVAIAILRYRLWDVDLIIRRTLVYSAVTLCLLGVYVLSIILLQRAFSLLTDQSQNELVTVLSTLAIAALFVPVRSRVQSIIDKRFYRRKYNAQQVLSEFAETVRDETDLDKLTGRLVEVVTETMQPRTVSVWLRRELPDK